MRALPMNSDAGKRAGEDPRRRHRVADQDALLEKVVNLVRLMRSLPGIHDFIEDADDFGVGMDGQVAADCPGAQPTSPQNPGSVTGAGGEEPASHADGPSPFE
jgi:hypothetical protein